MDESYVKGVVHLLTIYSAPCHPRYPCHSFFSQRN